MRPIGFAYGIAPGLRPEETVAAAVAGGFDAVGLNIDPENWNRQTIAEVRSRVADAGMFVIDAEVIWIRSGARNPAHLRFLDIAAEVGAINVLTVIADPDVSAASATYAHLCDEGGRRGLRINLEFGIFTEVHRLEQALGIVEASGSDAAAVLVDPIHLHRSGGSPEDLNELPRHRLSYAQFCDAPASLPDMASQASIFSDALDRRMLPGEGDLPLAALLAALPADLPLSVELRSKALREAFPDPVERAREVARSTRAFLAKYDRS